MYYTEPTTTNLFLSIKDKQPANDFGDKSLLTETSVLKLPIVG